MLQDDLRPRSVGGGRGLERDESGDAKLGVELGDGLLLLGSALDRGATIAVEEGLGVRSRGCGLEAEAGGVDADAPRFNVTLNVRVAVVTSESLKYFSLSQITML